ncbi:MAG: helix-turn-helix transcriptional regulator [Candidatus Marinimicrobia bacterium]|nr:helix-turn-helix transcriptional regulator [Candidatus Neomarinimicrobiota bacterium]
MNDYSYTKWNSLSDGALSKNLGSFIKYHRLDQNKTQEQVAYAANISRSTLSLLERGETVTVSTFLQVLRVLGLLYVMEGFEVQTQLSPITLAKMERDKRKRARSKPVQQKAESDW